MWLLWNEFRKESRLFWLFSCGGFLFISGFLLYKIGLQQMHVEGIAQIVLVVVFFFLFASFIWEMYRQIKSWKKSQYRLLPISEGTFYVSNLLFSWITTTIFMFVYYYCLVGLVFLLDKQVDMAHFQEYWKHLAVASYLFLSASIYVQFVYLLSSLLSERAPVKLQRASKYSLFLLLFAGQLTISDQLLTGYRTIAFMNPYQFKIVVGYVPFYLGDLIVDVIILAVSSIASIFMLKKYIEAERG